VAAYFNYSGGTQRYTAFDERLGQLNNGDIETAHLWVVGIEAEYNAVSKRPGYMLEVTLPSGQSTQSIHTFLSKIKRVTFVGIPWGDRSRTAARVLGAGASVIGCLLIWCLFIKLLVDKVPEESERRRLRMDAEIKLIGIHLLGGLAVMLAFTFASGAGGQGGSNIAEFLDGAVHNQFDEIRVSISGLGGDYRPGVAVKFASGFAPPPPRELPELVAAVRKARASEFHGDQTGMFGRVFDRYSLFIEVLELLLFSSIVYMVARSSILAKW
jgi:hypothetical protein